MTHSAQQRFGWPQLWAALLLLAFLLECVLLAARRPDEPVLAPAALDPTRLGMDYPYSPLTRAIAELSLRVAPRAALLWTARAPVILFGLLLGASLWYVARRLYGNRAGYIALALYVFSPAIIVRSTAVAPEIGAAWGAFGCVFTAIAVAHTLYAPREVVLWNWKRITLMGVAIGLGVASHLAVAITVPLALAFMLYLVPQRKGAAVVILAAGCALGCVLLLAATHFHPQALANAWRALAFSGMRPGAVASGVSWRLLGHFLWHESPALLPLLAVALVAFVAWPRTRFFGTAAPLIVTAVLLAMTFTLPHFAGFSFLVIALPFAFVFVAGMFADLLETRYSGLVLGATSGILLAQALFSLTALLLLR
jgi:4-amino-4-deoxy-L-arabinose transferase-like glycosyltransferase